MALGRRDAEPDEAPTMAPVSDPEALRDPHAIELPPDTDDELEDEDARVIGTCGACGEPVLDIDPHHSESGEIYHAEHSETRAKHDRAVRKSRRRYERSAAAKSRAATAREV